MNHFRCGVVPANCSQATEKPFYQPCPRFLFSSCTANALLVIPLLQNKRVGRRKKRCWHKIRGISLPKFIAAVRGKSKGVSKKLTIAVFLCWVREVWWWRWWWWWWWWWWWRWWWCPRPNRDWLFAWSQPPLIDRLQNRGNNQPNCPNRQWPQN